MSNYPLYNTPATVNQTQLIGVGTLDFWDIENQDFKALTVDDNTLFLDGVPVGGGNITVQEVDGTPSHPVHTIVFPNGTVGIQGTTATITLAGSGDMVLASAQTVSGAKTFLDSTLLLRNAANTFSAQFTNTNTAARTYTLPNATGTVALTSDITGDNSGTNTGDQTITLTGAVTGSGTGTFAASLGSFTRSQLDTAVSDANVMYVGDAPTAHNQAWSTITSKPTTLLGYGITDAASSVHVHAASDITSGTVDPARLGSGSSITTKFLRGDSTWQTISGGGDALTTNPLSQFAATTSSQLAGVISDETGSGALVFATSPTLVTPALGTPTSGILTNCTGTASGLTAGNVTTNANLTGHVTSVGNSAVLGSFTKSQLDSAVSDGNVLYVGDVTSNATHTGDVTGSTALTIKTDVALAGNPTTTTQATTDNSTRIATTAFVKTAIPGAITIHIDTTTTGAKKLFLPVDYACTITGWELLANTSGSVVIDIWKDTYANYPPVVGDSITGSAKPTISSAEKAASTTLTGWTTALAAGDKIEVNVDSVTTITKVTLQLTVTRS